jgi:hypothetical protein
VNDIKTFKHINDARTFIVDKLSDDTLLGRNGFKMFESKYIIHYKPDQEFAAQLLQKAIRETDLVANGVNAVEINLYDIVLAYLDEEGIWDDIVNAEKTTESEVLIEMLRATVEPTEVLIPKVRQTLAEAEPYDLVFITGIGETFPYIRTHHILSGIETDKPVVVWFPGTFEKFDDGTSSLDILNIPQGFGGGYYRATNIFAL